MPTKQKRGWANSLTIFEYSQHLKKNKARVMFEVIMLTRRDRRGLKRELVDDDDEDNLGEGSTMLRRRYSCIIQLVLRPLGGRPR